MECVKLVKEYEMKINKDVVFTDDLPVKWSCVGDKGADGNCDFKFTLLSADPSIDKKAIVTYVSFIGRYWETGWSGNSCSTWKVWQPVMKSRKFLEYSEVEREVTLTLNTKHPRGLPFDNAVKIVFTLIIPKNRSLQFSGYDFTEKNVDHDQILVVGEQKFYVYKAVLSHYSPFFNTLFNNKNFEESKKDEIELKDLDAKEFEVLLQVIHPTTITVNSENVEFLWKLADRFGISSVATMCESFICNLEGKQPGAFSLANRMKMAQLYNSDKLMAFLIKEMEKL